MGLMDIRRRILADAPQLATATGAVASFSTDMAVPLKKCEFGIEPVQSGTGDPSPSNVRPISGWTGANISRTGVNVWDEQWEVGSINDSGQNYNTSSQIRSKNYIPCRPNTVYNFVSPMTSNDVRIAYYQADKTFISLGAWQYNGAFTTPSTAYFMRFFTAAAYGTTYNNDISINYPSTDTAYHAYVGNTYPVQFPAQGKNLSSVESYPSSTGFWGTTFNSLKTVLNSLPAGTYSISTRQTIDDLGNLTTVRVEGVNVYSNGSTINTGRSAISDSSPSVGKSYTTTATIVITAENVGNITNVYLYFGAPAYGTFKGTIDHIQIEAGSPATTYEPYTNTVYGGTVDVTTGVLTVTHKMEKLGSLQGMKTDTNYQNFAVTPTDTMASGYAKTLVKSDTFKGFSQEQMSSKGNNFTWGSSADGTIRIKATDYGSMTYAEFRTAFADVMLVYELAEPITYQLTPQQIKALKGQNNVWCDTGNTTVQYWKH